MKIAVIGAGNGGQSISGYLSMQGYEVSLYDIDEQRIKALQEKGGIQLEGRIEGFGKVACITTDIAEAVRGACRDCHGDNSSQRASRSSKEHRTIHRGRASHHP